jgi:glycosyltransferase involved in cell wall biosynthesis
VTFDLVVATVDRVAELEVLLASLDRQTHQDFRVLLVDQNDDDRIEQVIRNHRSLRIERLPAGRGLARARNAALAHVEADVVAFPDDDCVYEPDLLERVALRFAEDDALDGLTGRADDSDRWKQEAATLTRENVWNRAISFTIFLRRPVVERVGTFDVALGLPSSSGEETEYLIRAIDCGARIEYDPGIVVHHPRKDVDLAALAAREGAGLGYILRKHRYPARTVVRLLVRPAGGALIALAHRDRAGARFQLETLRGRVRGYRS